MGQHSFDRERDRLGFRELAKLAGPQPRQKANTISGIRRATNPGAREVDNFENDSGLVDLEVLSTNDPGAVDRASVTPLASAPLFADDTVAPPPRSSRPAPPSSRPAVAAEPSRPSVAPAASASVAELRVMPTPLSVRVTPLRTGTRRTPVGAIGAVIGLAAIAAGAFFVIRSRAPEATVAIAPVAQSPLTQTAAVAQPVAQAPAAETVAQAPAPAHSDPGVDPMSLPKENDTASSHHAAAAHAWHGTHTGGQALVAKADPKDDDDAPAAKAEAPKAAPKAEAPAVPANNALLASIKVAAATAPAAPAPAAEPAPVPAAAPVGTAASTPLGAMAQRPSQGQITGALAGALPGARACLNDGDEPSRAHVVFGSDGAVQSVAVTGPAQGKPSEACIKTALGKAHVPAFAEATFGATVTVRP